MTDSNSVEPSMFDTLPGQFPGIENADPAAFGRFAFMLASMTEDEITSAYERDDLYSASADWQNQAVEVIGAAFRRLRWSEEAVTAEEFARKTEEESRIRQVEMAIVTRANELPAEEAKQVVAAFLRDKGYGFVTSYNPSAMFPDGREVFTPFADNKEANAEIHIPYDAHLTRPNGQEGDPTIAELLEKLPNRHRDEAAKQALESLVPIDKQEYEQLRLRYGAKAAALLCFEKAIDDLYGNSDTRKVLMEIDIPRFSTASVDMYKAWKNDQGLYEEMLEHVRLDVLESVAIAGYKTSGSVAVRSSAVYSEDGENHTGAGVYKSVVVNPRDAVAFREAVEAVYESVDSEDAIAYREQIGIDPELMGLLFQAYVEDEGRRGGVYGHANSEGANPNLIEVHTNNGTLYYDKPKVQSILLTESYSMHADEGSTLHSRPDHDSKLYDAVRNVRQVPHALVLAERLFGRPMQVEFAEGQIVQVRPLIGNQTGEAITFPDIDYLVEATGTGVGDVELEYLDNKYNNTDKTGYVVFSEEERFSIVENMRYFGADIHQGYKAIPKHGAVVILNPSSNGHIQAHCRERGILCIYPKRGRRDYSNNELADAIYGGDGYNPRKLRFVSDGYTARIYPAAEEDQQNY